MRRQRQVYTYADLRIAREEQEKAEANYPLRGKKPGQYRAAVIAARAKVDTIVASLNRQLAHQRRQVKNAASVEQQGEENLVRPSRDTSKPLPD